MIAVWLIFCLLTVGVCAQGSRPVWEDHGIRLTEEEAAWVRDHPRVRLVADPSWKPFSFLGRAGGYEGADLDLLRLVGQRLGITFEDVPCNCWDSAIKLIRSGGAEVVSPLSDLPERREYLIFSEPYFEFPVAIIARNDAPFFMSLDTLRSFRVAAPQGYATTIQLIKDHPGLTVDQTPRYHEALERVSDGQADAAVLNLAAANQYLRDHVTADLKVVGFTDYHPNSCIGTRRELPLLASALAKSLASVQPAERARIFQRWIAADYTPGGFRWRRHLPVLVLVVALAVAVLSFGFWHNHSLARELAERRRVETELRAARDRLVHLNAEKSRFLNMAAHDLKNPLNTVSGFAQLLMVGGSATPGEVKRYAGIIHEHTGRMHRLIVDLLNTRAIEEGSAKLPLEPLDLAALTAAVIAGFRPAAAGKRIALSGPEALAAVNVLANRDAMTRVLENLLSNAVKFAPADGAVTVAVEALPGTDRGRVTVADDGPGLSAADRERLYQPFERGSAQPTGAESSHGLGLFIVRRLVEEQGGSIQIAPGPLGGACFAVELPLARQTKA